MPSCRRLLVGLALAATVAAAPLRAPAGEVSVVASIKPIHSLVTGVMAGLGEPALLLRGAASPHGYSLRPSEARALAGADVVFWIGEDLETFLIKPLRALAARAAIVELAAADGVTLLPARAGGLWASDQDAAAGEEAHDRGRGGSDMHLWLDPRNAEAVVGAIVAALGAADPAEALAYEQNGRALRERLEALDRSLDAKLAPVRDRPFVVFHDAYQYFDRRYRLNAIGALAVDPERRPGAGRLREIHRRLAELGAACVFAEPQFEPALIDAVIESTGTRKGILDPLGAELPPGREQYFELMNGLADGLLDCLGATKAE